MSIGTLTIMQKYAIIDKKTNEFYPDPIYTTLKKIKDKIKYLINYRIEHNMEFRDYVIEKLSKDREEKHNQEWKAYCDMID